MSIVFSKNYVLTEEFPVTNDHPVIGWRNVVTPSTIFATYDNPSFPASNLANPATHLEWRASATGAQLIAVTTDEVDAIDYVGIARHNFGSQQIPVTILDVADNVLVDEVLLPDDSPALFRFTASSQAQIKIKLDAVDGQLPRAAVVYVGKLLVLERKIFAGHTPLKHARRTEIQNGRSETGNFLGRIELGAWRETTIPLSLLSPRWYRDFGGDAFMAAAATAPFFFGWRPQSYPFEVGYCWTTDDAMPAPASPANLIAFDLHVMGIV